jgi:hypothetical protein
MSKASLLFGVLLSFFALLHALGAWLVGGDIVGLGMIDLLHLLWAFAIAAWSFWFLRRLWSPFVDRGMESSIGVLNRTIPDSEKKAEPPIVAEFLVGLCAKRRYRSGLLQSLEEEFESNLAAGETKRRACRKYWAAALNSIAPQLLAAAKRVGIIGLIADYARRLLH